MTSFGGTEVPFKFICEVCDYKTCRKSQYERHLFTAKHKNTYNDLHNGLQKVQKSSTFTCNCGKEYLHRQSLYKHKLVCDLKPENITMTIEEYPPENNQYSGDFILELLHLFSFKMGVLNEKRCKSFLSYFTNFMNIIKIDFIIS
jgi:hypothetical protein